MAHHIAFEIEAQPDDVTCGPTCLHAVYQYFGDDLSLDHTIRDVKQLAEGGTLSALLGSHALQRGYRARIYTYNLSVFDPTWFFEAPWNDAAAKHLIERLEAQLEVKRNQKKLRIASECYIDFIRRGGEMYYEDLTPALIVRFLSAEVPILTGLNATHLYDCARETDDNEYDDLEGTPAGHFVVLCGYDPSKSMISVADPLHDNPGFGERYYAVDALRLMTAILLGVVTYDGNLLVIEPEDAPRTTALRSDTPSDGTPGDGAPRDAAPGTP